MGLAMGLAVTKDEFSEILPKGLPFPASRVRYYQISADFQRLVSIEVLQGTSSLASENTLIGVFVHIVCAYCISVYGRDKMSDERYKLDLRQLRSTLSSLNRFTNSKQTH